MRKLVIAVVIGVLVWVALSVASWALGVFETGDSSVFENIKSLVLVALSAVGANFYLGWTARNGRYAGIWVGLLWAVVTIAGDRLWYELGFFPPDFGWGEYLKDVALSYVLMPVVALVVTHSTLPSSRTRAPQVATPGQT